MTDIEKQQPDALTKRINAKYREVESLARSTVEAAMELGGMLVEKRDGLGHGEWLPWLKENFEGSKSHAYNFINLYENRNTLLGGNFQRVGTLTLREALRAIAAPEEEKGRSLADEIASEYVMTSEEEEWFASLPEQEKLLHHRHCLLIKYMFTTDNPDDPDRAYREKVVGHLDKLDTALRPIDLPEDYTDRQYCEEVLTYRQMHQPIGDLIADCVIRRLDSEEVFKHFCATFGIKEEDQD